MTQETNTLQQEDFTPVTLTDIQLEAYNQANAELEAMKKELEAKKYYSDLEEKDIKALLNFLQEEAPWKFMESLGIKEVAKEIVASLEKSKKLFIGATAYEALYYYLSKVEGTGEKVNSKYIKDLDTYLRLLKAINAVRSAAATDNEKLKELEYVVACRAEGITPEVTPAAE